MVEEAIEFSKPPLPTLTPEEKQSYRDLLRLTYLTHTLLKKEGAGRLLPGSSKWESKWRKLHTSFHHLQLPPYFLCNHKDPTYPAFLFISEALEERGKAVYDRKTGIYKWEWRSPEEIRQIRRTQEVFRHTRQLEKEESRELPVGDPSWRSAWESIHQGYDTIPIKLRDNPDFPGWICQYVKRRLDERGEFINNPRTGLPTWRWRTPEDVVTQIAKAQPLKPSTFIKIEAPGAKSPRNIRPRSQRERKSAWIY